MATASAICIVLVVVFHLADHQHLPIELWLPVFAVSVVAHAYRFRRFWRYVAEYVTGEVLLQTPAGQS
jgi:prepilin signal peptidase PulO-like enzyme (type II secretory pathway)